MMTKEGCTKAVDLMIPKAGIFVLGHGHTSHIVKILNFIKQARALEGGSMLCINLMTSINL